MRARSSRDLQASLAVVHFELAKLRMVTYSERVLSYCNGLVSVQRDLEDQLQLLVAEQRERGEA